MAETLLFVDGEDIESARSAAGEGTTVVAFSELAAACLGRAGIPFRRSVEALGDDPEMPLYRAAADWTQAFGRTAVDETGRSLKEELRFRGTTLWWWAEIYLHHNTEAAGRVRFLETVSRVSEVFGGRRLRTLGLAEDETLLVERFCAARSLGFTRGPCRSEKSGARSALALGLVEASKLVATAVKGAGGPDVRLIPRSIVFISHAAFWKTRPDNTGREEHYEHYFDALLKESRRRGLPTVTLGVGPKSTFRTRSVAEKWKERLSVRRDERFVHINRYVTPGLAAQALKAFGRALRIRNHFHHATSLRTAFSHRGVSFHDLSHEDFGRTLLHQVPWAARTLLEFEAAFAGLHPRLVCMYAESSGLGRAAIQAARSRSVKTLAVQHGILYPNYFSYERTDEDLALGTPIPDVTAMYGEDGVRLLETAFRYPKGRVVVTGSPRYDALAAETRTVDREERRKSLGVGESEKLVVLASRYTGIRDTHKASGPAFPALLTAIAGISGARLIVKPHPAEPLNAYDKDLQVAALGDRARVMADRPLTDILPATDLLVTVESLSATEALVAGVPVVVLRHPTNLRELVACGAAVGVADGDDPRPAIERLLSDPEAIASWRRARDAALKDAAHGLDGGSLDRLMALVSGMAGLN